jgi:hypothetical protein
MRFVIDMPFDLLIKKANFENESREFISHWLNGHADGIRFLNMNSKNNYAFGMTESDKIVNGWRKQVDEIARKNLNEK